MSGREVELPLSQHSRNLKADPLFASGQAQGTLKTASQEQARVNILN